MLLSPGDVQSLSLGSQQHESCSLVIFEDPVVASQIVLEFCTIVHGLAPMLCSTKPRRLVHRLAEKSQEIRRKLFEVEFPSGVDVLAVACFGELYHILVIFFQIVPSWPSSLHL